MKLLNFFMELTKFKTTSVCYDTGITIKSQRLELLTRNSASSFGKLELRSSPVLYAREKAQARLIRQTWSFLITINSGRGNTPLLHRVQHSRFGNIKRSNKISIIRELKVSREVKFSFFFFFKSRFILLLHNFQNRRSIKK